VTNGISNHLSRFLFPYWCRWLGFFISISGIIAACLVYILNLKPAFLNIKVFAVFSYYFDKKFFSVIENDIGEEIIIILLLTGFFLISFSKLKIESEISVVLRIKALVLSVYINTIFLLFSTIFIYGIGFLAITVINCFSLFVINITIFAILLLKNKKQTHLYGPLPQVY
jgi:hypothetical protein